VALGRTTAKVWRGAEMTQVRLSVDLCAIYWHFLLLVWLVLLGLLTGWTDDFVEICRRLLNRERPDGRDCADQTPENRLRGLQGCEASPPTGPRISALSRMSPGARP